MIKVLTFITSLIQRSSERGTKPTPITPTPITYCTEITENE